MDKQPKGLVMRISKYVWNGALALGLCLFSLGASAKTLDQALAHAYENSPDLTSAFLSVRAAREGIRAAEGGLLPTLGAQGSIDYNQTSPSLPQDGWSDSIGISYSQTLFDNNQTGAAIQAAVARYDAAVQNARNAEQNVLLAVVQAYVNVITNRRIVEIRGESIGFVEAQGQSARDRLELGESTELDVSQADASLAQAVASHQSALNNLRDSEANYERWVGRAAGDLSARYEYGALLPSSLETAIARATSSHPALLASTAEFRAAQFGYEETLAGFGPNLSITGQVGAGGFTGDRVSTSASVSLSLSIPIYTPVRDPAVEQANINQMQTQVDGFATRDQIVEAVRQGWSGIETATAQIESATAAVAASRLALQAVVDQNELGQTTTLDVLNQRAQVASIEESLISAQAQLTIAAYSLIAATGTLSAQALGLPVQLRDTEGSVAIPAEVVSADPRDVWDGLR